MKKVFVILVAGLISATLVSYFGLQWKVRKSVDQMFSSTPFIDASYESVNVEYNGRLVIRGIAIYVPANQTSVAINSVALDTGGLLNTLKLESEFKSGKLPETLKLSINGFSTDISSGFVADAQEAYSPGPFSQIVAFGCGRFVAIGPQALFDMGLRNLTFDLDLGYVYDYGTDSLTSSIDFYFDSVANLVMNQTVIGIAPLMEDYKSAMMGSFDPKSVSTSEVQIQYVDLGYNRKQADFCARAAGKEIKAWRELNLAMVAEVLKDIDLKSNFDALKLYSDLTADRARFDLSMRPIAGFTAADFQMYQFSDLIDLLDLRLNVNDSPVEITELSWDQKKWQSLNLSAIRKAFRVEPASEVAAAQQQEAPRRLQRILREVPLTDLGRYQHRTVQVTRRDGKRFTGEMTEVSAQRIVVRTRFNSGYTDLPLLRRELAVVKVYPED